MKRIWYVFIFVLIGILSSCSSVVNRYGEDIVKRNKIFVVLPFENNTETPLAGLRVASIVEAVASSKGYRLKDGIYQKEQKEYTKKDVDDLINTLKEKDIDYIITGSVNEFRYKTGIDGEPAVSITLKIYDLKNNSMVINSVGSKTGWSHESITTVAQKIVNRLLP